MSGDNSVFNGKTDKNVPERQNMTLHIFGYAGCSTVKKAVQWAEAEKLPFEYKHFIKVDDLENSLRQWVSLAGIDAVFNHKAQTFKKLDDAERDAITQSEDTMIKAMASEPRFIKRPVGTDGKTALTGFDEAAWQQAFA